MKLIDHTIVTANSVSETSRREKTSGAHSTAVSQRLVLILGASLTACGGPVLLNTLGETSLATLQILLEICRFGLVAYQIFGR